MEAQLVEHRDRVAHLCRRFGVSRLEVFGSAVDGTFGAQRSDCDFIARFTDDPQASLAKRFLGFGDALELLPGRKVDPMRSEEHTSEPSHG